VAVVLGPDDAPGTVAGVTTTQDLIDAVLYGSTGYETGLDALTVAPAPEVDRALDVALRERCDRLWQRGWQPGELHRIAVRSGRAPLAELIRDAVAEHLSRFPPDRVDQRWRAQATALDARVWWTSQHLTEFARRYRHDRSTLLDDVLTLIGILSRLPAIEVLVPPPGTAAPGTSVTPRSPGVGSDPGSGIGSGLLHRVRSLLAKAESTTFPAEAQALTVKAQELIARHSIHDALLASRFDGPAVVPFARRIGVDHPYESEKVSLLNTVAVANRCHTVWSPEFGFCTIFGFDQDIDAVQLLYTSLLVQASQALSGTEPPSGKAGKTRLKTFRRSFLVAFAVRIGERLTESARAELAAVDTPDLLPALADRDQRVRETMRRAFPKTTRARSSRIDSGEGWLCGRTAADRAGIS
jgi:CBS domain-containing protein